MAAPLAIRDYVFDPDDPRAPTSAQWAKMSEEERRRVVDMLPAEVPADVFAPEGDPHRKAKSATVDALDGYFRRVGRKVYVSSELAVFYPGEPRIVPDVLAVLDVEPRERMKWTVEDEGKGLDFVLEVYVSGDRRKDYEKNVETYARLGIREYFVFDRGRLGLRGYRLPSPGARVYRPILPQEGRYASAVLGLDLLLEGAKLRFLHGGALLPESEEIIAKLGGLLDDVIAHKEEAEKRADDLERQLAEERRQREEDRRQREEDRRQREEDRRQREEDRRQREETERKLAEALAEIERLKRS